MLLTSFELSFERFSLEARLPAGVRENEPALKRKSPHAKQVFKQWNTHLDKQTLG